MKNINKHLTQGFILVATCFMLVGCGAQTGTTTVDSSNGLSSNNSTTVTAANTSTTNTTTSTTPTGCTADPNASVKATGATSTIPFTLLNHTLYGTGGKILTSSTSMLSGNSANGDYRLPGSFSTKSILFIQGGTLDATLQTKQVSSDFTGSTCGNYGWMHPITRARVTVTLRNSAGTIIGNPSTVTLGACPVSVDFHDALANNLSRVYITLSDPTSDDGMPKQGVFPYNSVFTPDNSVLNSLYSPRNGCEYSLGGTIQVTTDAAGAT